MNILNIRLNIILNILNIRLNILNICIRFNFIKFFNLLQKRYINFHNSGFKYAGISLIDRPQLGDPYVYKLECNSVIFINYVVHSLLTYKKLENEELPSRRSNPHVFDRTEKSIIKIPCDDLYDEELLESDKLHNIYIYVDNIKGTLDIQ